MADIVSVVITTYKRPTEVVLRAAKSILSQTYKDIELIIVDDSPEAFDKRDEVERHVKELSGDIKYIKHEKNMGACAARNTGIRAAKGDYVAFLDDDDEWLPEKLEKQMKKFSSPKTALVYCGCYVLNEEKGSKTIQKKQYYKGAVYEELILENFIGSTSFVVLKKDIAYKAGLFDEKMRSAQDYDLWLRVAKIAEVDYVDEPLVNYYIHAGENISGDPKKKIQGLERLNQKNWDYISKNKEAKWIRTIKLAPFYAMDRQYGRAFLIWMKGCVIDLKKVRINMQYLRKCIARGLRQNKKRSGK